MRLIDADALKDEFVKHEDRKGYLIVDWEVLIDNAPTVEITEEQAIDKLHDTGWLPLHDKEMTERPTGHWIEFKGGYYKCDKCGEVERAKKNFCSRCGVYMRKEASDE